eukprot:GHVL01039576.1.p1 GENE.GHVL01039576.1~~GHVL01039576.1.p1  ORF type:complete len:428 (+),score=60.25 GHVL01039576.1:36-1319(+)
MEYELTVPKISVSFTEHPQPAIRNVINVTPEEVEDKKYKLLLDNKLFRAKEYQYSKRLTLPLHCEKIDASSTFWRAYMSWTDGHDTVLETWPIEKAIEHLAYYIQNDRGRKNIVVVLTIDNSNQTLHCFNGCKNDIICAPLSQVSDIHLYNDNFLKKKINSFEEKNLRFVIFGGEIIQRTFSKEYLSGIGSRITLLYPHSKMLLVISPTTEMQRNYVIQYFLPRPCGIINSDKKTSDWQSSLDYSFQKFKYFWHNHPLLDPKSSIRISVCGMLSGHDCPGSQRESINKVISLIALYRNKDKMGYVVCQTPALAELLYEELLAKDIKVIYWVGEKPITITQKKNTHQKRVHTSSIWLKKASKKTHSDIPTCAEKMSDIPTCAEKMSSQSFVEDDGRLASFEAKKSLAKIQDFKSTSIDGELYLYIICT